MHNVNVKFKKDTSTVILLLIFYKRKRYIIKFFSVYAKYFENGRNMLDQRIITHNVVFIEY